MKSLVTFESVKNGADADVAGWKIPNGVSTPSGLKS